MFDHIAAGVHCRSIVRLICKFHWLELPVFPWTWIDETVQLAAGSTSSRSSCNRSSYTLSGPPENFSSTYLHLPTAELVEIARGFKYGVNCLSMMVAPTNACLPASRRQRSGNRVQKEAQVDLMRGVVSDKRKLVFVVVGQYTPAGKDTRVFSRFLNMTFFNGQRAVAADEQAHRRFTADSQGLTCTAVAQQMHLQPLKCRSSR